MNRRLPLLLIFLHASLGVAFKVLAGMDITWARLAQFPLIKLYASTQERLEFKPAEGVTIPTAEHPFATLEISHLLTALELLRQSNYFMPAPAYLLQQERATAGIIGLPLPRDSDLNIHYALVSHKRTTNSPLHNWLWDLITCTIRDLRSIQHRKLRQRMTAGSEDAG